MTTHYQSFTPCMYAHAPIRFFLFCALIPIAGIGIVCLLVWWLHANSREIIIDDKKCIYKSGILFTQQSHIPHNDILSIIISRAAALGDEPTGSITITSRSNCLKKIYISGIVNPVSIKNLIEEHRSSECAQTELSSNSSIERVIDLAALREKQLLSIKEFEVLKSYILEQAG